MIISLALHSTPVQVNFRIENSEESFDFGWDQISNEKKEICVDERKKSMSER